MKKNNKKTNSAEISVTAPNAYAETENAFELINKYGTYNIQPTADTENKYPAIAQGHSTKSEKDKKNGI